MGKKLGNLIKKARTDADMTQEQLARKIKGVTAHSISDYERGEAEPTQAVVKDIAKATGVTQKSLLDAMPKSSTTKRTTTSTTKKTTTTKRTTSTAKKSSMQVTAAEKRLVERFREADAESKKRALAALRGGKSGIDDIFEEFLKSLR